MIISLDGGHFVLPAVLHYATHGLWGCCRCLPRRETKSASSLSLACTATRSCASNSKMLITIQVLDNFVNPWFLDQQNAQAIRYKPARDDSRSLRRLMQVHLGNFHIGDHYRICSMRNWSSPSSSSALPSAKSLSPSRSFCVEGKGKLLRPQRLVRMPLKASVYLRCPSTA